MQPELLNYTITAVWPLLQNVSSYNQSTKAIVAKSVSISSSKLLIPQLNLGIGVVGAILNILALICICSNKKFLKKSAFLTGLIVGNIFNSGYSISNGTHRLLNALDPLRNPNYTAWDCMMAPFIPTWALLGGEAPSLIILLFGFERLSALATPAWHFQKWKPKWSWMAVGVVYVYAFVTVVIAWFVVAFAKPSDSGAVSRDCFVHSVIGQAFSCYYYGLQIFCGVAAVVATLSALAAGWCRLKMSQTDSTKSRLHKQIRITRHMLALAVVDFFLVAVSNLVLYLTMLTKFTGLPSGASNHGAVAYCCNATVCVLAYLAVNKNFRDCFLKCYKLEKGVNSLTNRVSKKKANIVTPISVATPLHIAVASTNF